MKRLLLGMAVVIALGAATGAHAAPVTPEIEADYAAALEWWAVEAPPMCTTVDLETAATAPEGEDGDYVDASATRPRGRPTTCRITFFEDTWNSLSPCMQEMITRHEVGHLLGYGHSSDPTSIMAPRVDADIWCPEAPAVAPLQAPTSPTSSSIPGPEPVEPGIRRWEKRRQYCAGLALHVRNWSRVHACWVRARIMREALGL